MALFGVGLNSTVNRILTEFKLTIAKHKGGASLGDL
jgi:hypothetical protein